MKKKIALIFLLVFVALVAGILSLSIRPEYSSVNYNPADSQNETDKTVKFDSSGKLKILHITDTHLDTDNIDISLVLINEALKREKKYLTY